MKEIVLTAVASLMLVFSAKAQVFVLEEDGNNRDGGKPIEFIVPDHFENDDQTPGEEERNLRIHHWAAALSCLPA